MAGLKYSDYERRLACKQRGFNWSIYHNPTEETREIFLLAIAVARRLEGGLDVSMWWVEEPNPCWVNPDAPDVMVAAWVVSAIRTCMRDGCWFVPEGWGLEGPIGRKCDYCKGSGIGAFMPQCHVCNGTGEIQDGS